MQQHTVVLSYQLPLSELLPSLFKFRFFDTLTPSLSRMARERMRRNLKCERYRFTIRSQELRILIFNTTNTRLIVSPLKPRCCKNRLRLAHSLGGSEVSSPYLPA